MVGDHPPEPIWRRMVGRALVQDHGRAERERAENEPGTHHPADVRIPEDRVVLADVEAMRHVLSGLDGEAAVYVERPFRLSGGAGRVDDHQRVFGVELVSRRAVGLVLQQHLPDLVAAVRPRHLADDAAVHDHPRHGRTPDQGAVQRLLHRHDLPAPVEAVGADDHFRLAVL